MSISTKSYLSSLASGPVIQCKKMGQEESRASRFYLELDSPTESETFVSHRRRKPLLVAAIDFGTAFSGYAFSFTSDYQRDPAKVTAKKWNGSRDSYSKVPTCILIKKNGKTARAFGYDAEVQYANDPGRDNLYLFKKFKMMLDAENGINKDLQIKDVKGKTLPAMTVFSLSIQWLKEDLVRTIDKHVGGKVKPSDIVWVLTVPAIWNDTAKQFMREAAIRAGIPDDQLDIALEPEAATYLCRHLTHSNFDGKYVELSSLPTGSQYMVLDAGGGTVDITVHEVVDVQTVKEVYAASGGPWGGETVDDAFFKLLETITGPGFRAKLREVEYEDDIAIVEVFEIKKKSILSKQTEPVKLQLPIHRFNEICNALFHENFAARLKKANLGNAVTINSDHLIIQASVFKDLFTSAIGNITKHLKDLLRRPTESKCKHIIMVGGFSESNILQEAVKKACPRQTVIVPVEAGLMVVKGAVVFGHEPSMISQRISKYTYGVEVNEDSDEILKSSFLPYPREGIFYPLVKAGDVVKVGQPSKPISLSPQIKNADQLSIKLFVIQGEAPTFVTDEGCRFAGELRVPLRKSKSLGQKGVSVQVIFGGTEVQVRCEEEESGEITKGLIEFLV